MRSPRLLIALAVALVSLISYWASRSYNPVTDETQHVSITAEQEIALGLQAAPEMARQHGGLSEDAAARSRVQDVGKRLIAGTAASQTPYRFDFHLLDDAQTINAFALPGGQIFITEALFRRLKTEGQLAGVLAHEIGHVVARHSAEHIAKQQLTQGLTGAAVLATYDPGNPASRNAPAVVAMIGQLVNLKL